MHIVLLDPPRGNPPTRGAPEGFWGGTGDLTTLELRSQPINRISFQNVAQDAHELPIGFSIRVHVIGTGNV